TCSGLGRRAGQVGRQKMPVVLTAVTNTPSNDASRSWKAASMTRREGRAGALMRSFMGSIIAQPSHAPLPGIARRISLRYFSQGSVRQLIQALLDTGPL